MSLVVLYENETADFVNFEKFLSLHYVLILLFSKLVLLPNNLKYLFKERKIYEILCKTPHQ